MIALGEDEFKVSLPLRRPGIGLPHCADPRASVGGPTAVVTATGTPIVLAAEGARQLIERPHRRAPALLRAADVLLAEADNHRDLTVQIQLSGSRSPG
jgi:hypothetical protein